MNLAVSILCFLTFLAFNRSLYRDLYIGNPDDKFFSLTTIEKLTVPQDSFLRKLAMFMEFRKTDTKFVYIRLVPYLIQIPITIVSMILLLINQFIVYFIPINIVVIFTIIFGAVNLIYDAILKFLSRGLRI